MERRTSGTRSSFAPQLLWPGRFETEKNSAFSGGNAEDTQAVDLTLSRSAVHHSELKNYLVGPEAFVFAVVHRLGFLATSRLVIRFA